jgi:formylglycine-generating enzyme required for sulfatase activity
MKSVRCLAWLAVFLGTALTGSVLAASENSPPVNPDPEHLVWIKPGTFTMGSPATEQDRMDDREGPQTQVTISQGFWMSKHETTQEEYQSVMGTNSSYFQGWKLFRLRVWQAVMGTNQSRFKGDTKRPVETVSWHDATNYCAKMTAGERAAGRLPAGYEYRLPTEAEWEYACRAGTTTATAYGDSLSSTQANFAGNKPYGGAANGPYLENTTKVGSYAPNAWGLYDMHGNVWEWCWDWYGPYPGEGVIDPRGPNTGSDRVFRGGGWNSYGGDCRSADRDYGWPDYRGRNGGFRPVLAPGQ